MEANRVGRREGADEGAHPIRIGEIEILVVREFPDTFESVGSRRRRLDREPFVEDQWIALPTGVEMRESFVASRVLEIREDEERALRIGHVVGRPVLRKGGCDRVPGADPGEEPKSRVATSATTRSFALTVRTVMGKLMSTTSACPNFKTP